MSGAALQRPQMALKPGYSPSAFFEKPDRVTDIGIKMN